MTQRYLGGIITANPVEPSSNLSNASASGMWTLQEALSFYRAGDWPDPTNTPTVGLFAGGIGTDGSTQVNEIDTITPETLGDSTDFGDLSLARGGMAGFSSDTRGIFAGGQLNGSPYRSDTIDYVTFASAGNATDFGNLTYNGAWRSGLSNNVRGISAGGNNASQTVVNNIDYITIPSTGNATDFGDLTVARLKSNGGLASTTRGVIGGGYNDSSATLYNTIDYINRVILDIQNRPQYRKNAGAKKEYQPKTYDNRKLKGITDNFDKPNPESSITPGYEFTETGGLLKPETNANNFRLSILSIFSLRISSEASSEVSVTTTKTFSFVAGITSHSFKFDKASIRCCFLPS